MREAEWNGADFIKQPQLIGAEFYFQRGEIVVKLGDLARPNDGDDRLIAMEQPRKSHLRRASAELLGDLLDGGDDFFRAISRWFKWGHHLAAVSAVLGLGTADR